MSAPRLSSAEARIARAYDGRDGALYDRLIASPLGAELLFRVFWGASHRAVTGAIDQHLGDVRGQTVLDVPVGGGADLMSRAAWLRGARAVIGVDLSRDMLHRAARRLPRHGLGAVRLIRAPVTALPLATGSIDLILAINSLHCFADLPGALAELRRVAAPGARLVGSCVVSGASARADQRIRRMIDHGHFAAALDEFSVTAALAAAGFVPIHTERHGADLVFATAPVTR
ncbi:MAG: class I SAM-dependent methyltransferase [Deltaproteobacteria bacterium]|nr:class I SAM-dependent methyltransferase [Deltaproteobacteria bacterium]